MLSITDLLDFIDLDRETVQIVNDATRLSEAESAAMASEFLRTHRGIYLRQKRRRNINKRNSSFVS